MVIRAATLALKDIKRFQFVFVGRVLCSVVLASLGIGICAMMCNHQLREAENSTHERIMSTVFFLSYTFVVFAEVYRRRQMSSTVWKMPSDDECRSSLRFVACLLGIYFHAPLLLANYSLGLPSTVFWSPLLGTFVLPPLIHRFLSGSMVMSSLLKVMGAIILVTTSPPVLLVPGVFPSYTIYIIGVYTPLHLLLLVLWL